MTRRDEYIAEHPLDPDISIEPFATSSVTEADVLELWAAEAGLTAAEASRRVSEVLLVAVGRDTGQLAGVFTAGLRRSVQLAATLWYARAFVTSTRRSLNVASHLLDQGRVLLEQRYVDGTDRRAAGVWLDVENEGLKRVWPEAEWPLGFTFIGENSRGDHVRVRWFEGAVVPAGG